MGKSKKKLRPSLEEAAEKTAVSQTEPPSSSSTTSLTCLHMPPALFFAHAQPRAVVDPQLFKKKKGLSKNTDAQTGGGVTPVALLKSAVREALGQ